MVMIISARLSISKRLRIKNLSPIFDLITVNMSTASSKSNRLVGVTSMLSTSDKAHNLEQVKTLVAQAKSSNAAAVFFPEGCDYIGENRYQTRELAEPIDGGHVVAEYRKLAKDNKLYLSFGGVHEVFIDPKTGEPSEKVFNTHIMIDPDGNIIGKYRKLHMFNVDTPEFKYRESAIAEPGSEIVPPIKTPFGNVGLQICYDLRFPEASTHLRKLGATILTYPSAFSVSTGKAHWEVLLRSRAIENQCYVIAAAQNGKHNKKRSSYGHALIVDPWGTVVAECDQNKPVDISFCEIEDEKVTHVRSNMPCFDHRRDDIYNIRVSPAKSVDRVEQFTFGPHIIPPEVVFYESNLSYAFTNIRCVVPGHVLVATKRPVRLLAEMTADEVNDFYGTISMVERVACKIHGTESSTVNIQNGEFSGQTVAHVHCHIMPRKKGDFKHNDMIYIELSRHDNPEEELEERRPVEEMAEEAEIFRRTFDEMFSN